VGKGRYTIDWLIVDDLGGVCRQESHLNVKPPQQIILSPGRIVDTTGQRLERELQRDTRPKLSRLTVLMDATPRLSEDPKRLPAALSQLDLDSLIQSFDEILLDLPSSSVRLICFNLDQQTELFRDKDFHLGSLENVTAHLKQLSLATLDAKAAAQKPGHLAMLARLINEEARATPPADAVVFFGPQERFRDSIPKQDLPRLSGRPAFFLLRYENAYTRDDTVAKAVRTIGGKVVGFTIFQGLPRAVGKIRQMLLPRQN
jgi:hypothetical protein